VVAALGAGLALMTVVAFVAISLALVGARTARDEEALYRQAAEGARLQTQLALDRSERSGYFGNIARARSQWLLNDVRAAAQLLERCPPQRRGWEWHYLHGLQHAELLALPGDVGPWVNGVAYSPDGGALAVAGGNPYGDGDGGVRVYDAASGALRWRAAGLPRMAYEVAYSPDGRLLATAGGTWAHPGHGELLLWDAATGKLLRRFPEKEASPLLSVAFSPDGKRLAAGALGGTLRVWDLEGGEVYHTTHRERVRRVAFSGDGRLLMAGHDSEVCWHDAACGKVRWRWTGLGHAPALSPDGRRLATLEANHVRIWDVSRLGAAGDAPALVQSFSGHEGDILSAAFHPDGQTIATTGADGTVRLWGVTNPQEQAVYRGHEGRVVAIAFHPDGRRLATGGRQPGDVKVWDLTRPVEYTEAVNFGPDRRDIDALAFTADDRELLVLGKHGALRRWDVGRGLIVQERALDCSGEWLVPATTAAFSGDGRLLAAVRKGDPRHVGLIETASGRERLVLRGHTARVWHVAGDRTGTRVLTAAFGSKDRRPYRELKVWDAATGVLLREEIAFDEITDCLALSPDGRRLAVGGRVRSAPPGKVTATLSVSDAAGATAPVLRLPVEGGAVRAVAFSGDGRCLAAAADSGRVRLWDASGTPLHARPLAGPDGLSALAFSPDGTRLAGVSRERVQLWDTASGQDVLFLRGAKPRPHDNGFNPLVAWSHDGARLAVSNWDRTVSVWDTADRTTAASKTAAAAHAARCALAWHLDRAEAYGSAGPTFASAFHRRQLLRLQPAAPFQFRQRGDFLARCGEWDLALADFAASFAERQPPEAKGIPEYAALLVHKGDRAACGRLRAVVLAQLANSPNPPELRALLRAGSLVTCSPAEAAGLLAGARRLREASPTDPGASYYAAVTHYRAGDWGAAARCLEEIANVRAAEAFAARVRVLRGLVALRQDRVAEAKELLAGTVAWLEREAKELPPVRGIAPVGWDWLTWLEVRALRREAESLLPNAGDG
jgi:WD40 repeat protein